ncbi:IPT/TIG domain-containing protein [Candidatus Uhrbacteria bacterium]|nr:IPT/TIG domain-containing protein [Candidatus Uhrbacteria bacterium]
MIKLRSLALAILTALSLLTGSVAFIPTVVHAQVDAGLTEVGGVIGLSATDPRVIASRIINVSLSLLTIIMLGLIIYAGFLWMTSGGNAEQVDRAKAMIRNAIIGVVLILSSWAIATFVINALIGATGGGGGGGAGGGGPGGGGALPGGGGSTAFQVVSISPGGSVPIRNVQVRFILSRDIDGATANANIRVLRVSDSSVVAGSLAVAGQVATFTPSAPCPAPNDTRFCFDGDTEFRAEIASGLRSTTGQSIACGGFSPACQMGFTTGNLVDTADPTANITSPFNGQGVPADDFVTVSLNASDDAGVSFVELFAGPDLIGIGAAPGSSTLRDISADVSWDTAGLVSGPMSLRATAHDIDSNTGDSPIVSVMVRPQHCFNGVQDAAEGETGIDCDALATPESCGACPGGACTTGSMCASGVCTGGICVEQPIITRISPPDGRPGTMVTISGSNFGTSTGQIIFADGQVATAPAACAASGIRTWWPNQVVVAVPDAAIDGPIQIINAAGLNDISNDDRGPRIDPFDVNDVARPGLCAADPESGIVGSSLALIGTGLGGASDRVFFNDREISSFTSWADDRIVLNAPVITPASYAVTARSGGVFSNSVSYRITTPVVTAGPEIISLSPENGPIGEYVTLQGRNFGSEVGKVNFRRGASDIAIADTDFPAACSLAFWSNTAITVKVPRTIRAGLGDEPISPGTYQVEVERRDTARSNTLPFAVNTSPQRPGICAIQPIAGPVDTEVAIIGERFGGDGTASFAGSGATRVPAIVGAGAWSSSRVTTRVPTAAVTGQVNLTVAGQTSNAVNFAVRNCNEDASICSVAGSVCCRSGACSDASGVCPASSPTAMFAWRVSSGILPVNPRVIEECSADPASKPPSPSPWSDRNGGNNVCVNSDVYIRFNTPLNIPTVATNLLVRQCTAGGSTPCTTTTPVSAAAGYPQISVNDGQGFIRFRPAALWNGTSTYQVVLRTGIQSSTNVPMLENADDCGAGNAYCFTFTTRAAGALCEVGSITVVPAPHTMDDVEIDQAYNAVPRAADDACVVLRGDVYNWSWYAGESPTSLDGRASVTNNIVAGRVSENQIVTSHAETGSDPVRINASTIDAGRSVNGRGDLFISLVPPKIEAYGPNCDEACLNGAIWFRFNVPMEPRSVDTSNYLLQRCTNENCRTFDLRVDLTTAPVRLTTIPGAPSGAPLRYVVVEPTRPGAAPGSPPETLLERGRFYKFVVYSGEGSFMSRSGLPLTGLNDPQGFAWTFRVKDGENARCTVEAVSMAPGEKIESSVGERQTFTANPESGPTACNANGEPLIADTTFNWTIEQTPTVSKFVNASGNGLVDTNPLIGQGCNNRCTPRGSAGLDGRVASCGNSVIETTNPNYCRNAAGTAACATSGAGAVGCRTIHGDSCRLMTPGSRGSEECDGGAPSATCGSSCLWLPAVGAATCGNGTLDRGEQCDSAVCVRGSCAPGTVPGCTLDCQLLGSSEGGSVCGNGSIGDGEACDDGNTSNGDGCSSQCLHEGSNAVLALCGNRVIDPGETCDNVGGVFPAGCNTTTCLKNGTTACTSGANCCGNGIIDAAEDCDGGQGCSNRCLVEGSSAEYDTPSFCGDGVTGPGEISACESAAGDSLPDATQLAEIVGDTIPDASGLMMSTVRATYDEKIGNASYGLQCGFTLESDCPAGTGLDDHGCCAARPSITSQYPPSLPAGVGICRNALITAEFNTRMADATVTANFVVAERVSGAAATCPAGTTTTVMQIDTSGMPWWKKMWVSFLSIFDAQPALADVYCVGNVRGRLNIDSSSTSTGSVATFTLERALKADTEYRITFKGDGDLLDNPGVREGIRSARGVVSDGSIVWSFRTGARICTVSSVDIRDLDTEHPNLYVAPVETHAYVAAPIALQDGRSVPLSTVAEYDWTWDLWNTSADTILGVTASAEPNRASGVSRNKNGAAYVSAGIRITRDEVTVPSTTDRVIRGSELATVLLCENPWPARADAPFSDSDGSRTIPATFVGGPFYNFSTLYCRDKNQPGLGGDLPAMSVVGVAPSPIDVGLGILRQYLFTFNEPSLRGDGIGIRIATNPLHQSPSAWYASKGFSGSPKAITVDGYEAVQDGNTVYIGAVNTTGLASGDIYPNIYVISRNPDAQAETIDIFDQMVANFVLNVNLQEDSQNACVYALDEAPHFSGDSFRGADGRSVACTADWECLNQNRNLRCASFKTKMQRDIKRIADFQRMTSALEATKTRTSKYPQLQTGSFLQTMSNSRWPSWQGAFTAEVGTTPPADPVNRFLTCGVCATGGSPCMDNADCAAGVSCNTRPGAVYDGIETSTCWNPTSRNFVCPRYNDANPASVSRIYQYRALNAGARYELSTELEGPSADRYRPRLLEEIKRCTNIDSVCNIASDCTVPGPGGAPLSTGSCVATGGKWIYAGICDGSTYGSDTVCGNGVIGPGETCEVGDTRPAVCTTPGSLVPNNGTTLQVCDLCTSFVNSPSSICVANALCGNGRIDRNQCLGGSGFRYGQACNTPGSLEECRDPRDTGAPTGIICTALATTETCDDGALNGTYGRCNRSCTGFDAFCGDGRLSPGETCDQGAANGSYCAPGTACSPATTCSIDCRGPAPYCGDADISAPNETCDGNSQTSNKALCINGPNLHEPCDSDADCGVLPGGSAATCGGSGGAALLACTGTLGLCSNGGPCTDDGDCDRPGPPRDVGTCVQYPTQRSRSCKSGAIVDACHWNDWTACQPIGSCGDGRIDPAEECDDGNRNSNDICTNLCKRNICGDAAINVGVEECDNGARNGTLSCDADYGSTCVSCSATCRQVASSGGFCGNAIKEGPEQCDRSDYGTSTPTCRELGYDYARDVSCAHYGFMRNTRTNAIECIGETAFSCRFSLSTESVWTEASLTPRAFPVLEANQICMLNQELCMLGTLCATPHPPRQDSITCNSGCGFTGCARCGEEEGDGVISAQVLDAIYSNQPVPNARVTLYSRGIRVGETYTASDGTFTFSSINRVSACSQYRIVVDFYQDNPCTGNTGRPSPGCNGQVWPAGLAAPNEASNGGYWPFESQTFGYNNFLSRGINDTGGNIFLAPRVARDETLVIATWNGTLPPGAYTDAHITLAPAVRPPSDVYWGGPGNQDIDGTAPHAYLACFHPDGSVGCGSFEIAPETIKYKRGTWGLTGRYGYYLVDYSTGGSPVQSYRYFDYVSTTVRIVTEDRLFTVKPATTVPTDSGCSDDTDDRKGKYWHVFSQDAGSGAITIPGAGKGLMLCDGSDQYGGGFGLPAVPLPGPIQGAGF